ncbi:MAG TPA: aminopeptidase P family protein [Solirubrobacteraceae bacterium]|nr:aminopeptidase P family protein [Solirubrobacteraceae bacterium]
MSAERPSRLAELIAGKDLAALVVEGAANLRWLTGYTGSSGLALMRADGTGVFYTDFRYETQAAAEVHPAFAREIVTGELPDALAEELPPGRVGFDDSTMSVRRHAKIAAVADGGVELVAAAGLPEQLRAVKDAREIALIAAAASLVDEIYRWLFEQPLAGRTERELAVALEHQMRVLGASGPSFDSIVAHGAHAALPHAQPRDVAIEPGTLVTFDIGAKLDGYCSDCTRTVAVGEPGELAREVYGVVLAAQLAGLAAVRPGTRGNEADAAARTVIEDAGYGERFGHGLGHGVGIDIHEAPRLTRLHTEDELVEANVVTVEPGVYLPGSLGVRIEDLVVVRDGQAEILSGFTKELLVLA